MGGNAVPGVSRADPELYASLRARAQSALRKHFSHVATPKEFPNKASYGDVDVIYAPYSSGIVKDVIASEFGDESAERAVINGKTVSFPLDNVQIDLIGESCENFDISVTYYSYGDLGRIIGGICHFYGLRWGKNGLLAPINCRDPHRATVSYPWNAEENETIPSDDWRTLLTLCDDRNSVFQYLGFDGASFEAGFSDEVQIWNWVTSSPYFDITIFNKSIALVLSDASARGKANIRDAYYRFLVWLDANASGLHKRADLPNPVIYFKREEDVSRMVDSHRRKELRKEKFSGRLLVEAGIESRHIGTLMAWLKKQFGRTFPVDISKGSDACFNEWIESSSCEEIKRWTLESVEEWRRECANGAETSNRLAPKHEARRR